jgi:hypothetical protein
MSAKVDHSDYATVVWCTDCSSWSELASGFLTGHDQAVDHERDVHPGVRKAYMARAKYRANHGL